jgi:hypothetical protein
MHLVASTITDPAKLISLPFTMFRAMSNFALEMFQKSADFITETFRLFV